MTEPILTAEIEDFSFPVTLAFSKSGKAYLSERISGRLWQINHEKHRLIKTFPIVPLVGHHETGLLGIALDPQFETNRFIYCYYTSGTSNKDFKNMVIRIKDDGTDEKVILANIPAGMIHNGGILAFAPDGTLYIGTGVDDLVKLQAQDKKTLNGKVLRIHKDGSIPNDNPFPNSPVYSYGHRNIFGLAFHPKTGKLYVSDVGPHENDEINLIEKGGNYGWPHVSGVREDNKFINPIQAYSPTITPVQSVFVGNAFYFGSYNEGTVHKITLRGDNYDHVEKDEIVYRGKPFTMVGVFHAPDNQFYITTASSVKRIKPKVETPLDSNPLLKTLKQGMNYPVQLIQGRLDQPKKSVKDLQPDQGAIIESGGEMIAAYRSKDKKLITLSPVCTHMGCIVGWNNLDKTWDCPCHGSRYEKDGKVKQGPAEKNLKNIAFTKT